MVYVYNELSGFFSGISRFVFINIECVQAEK